MPNASFPIANDHNEGKMVNCVFCKKEHYSAACERVASVAAHNDALLKKGLSNRSSCQSIIMFEFKEMLQVWTVASPSYL